MRVLINASAASEGGALTIINGYVESLKDKDGQYFILSPICPSFMPTNARWIKVSTDGLGTYFFTLLFSYFYYLFFRCDKLISFNNFNTLFPANEKVTYFHNYLIIDSSEAKYKLLRFTLKYLCQNNSKYVFQTPFVKQRFESLVSQTKQSIVMWPGLSIRHDSLTSCECEKKSLVWPSSSIDLIHKNFSLLVNIAKKCSDIDFIVPCCKPDFVTPANVKFVGKMTKNEFMRLLSSSNGVVVTSEQETVCLPIFESLFFGKPAFVYEKEYLDGIFELFPELNGIFLFQNAESFSVVAHSNLDFSNQKSNFVSNNWEF